MWPVVRMSIPLFAAGWFFGLGEWAAASFASFIFLAIVIAEADIKRRERELEEMKRVRDALLRSNTKRRSQDG